MGYGTISINYRYGVWIYGEIQTPIIADKKNIEEIKRAWLLSMANALRCDPEAILNGEIHDLESAITALKAAMTGHLLMTTLHANDGLNILERPEIEGVSARATGRSAVAD